MSYQLGPFITDEALLNASMEHLRKHGYRVAPDYYSGPEDPAIKSGVIAKQLGVSASAMTAALNDRRCPPFNATYSPGGHLTSLKPNPALSAWLLARFGQRAAAPA